ncbi:MAG: hypothetical protein ABIB72_03210 [Candidatus Falkowbacteria bacterium]
MLRVEKPLKIGVRTIGIFFYRSDDLSAKLVRNTIQNSFKKLEKIYRIPSKNLPQLYFELIYSREELNSKISKKTANWLVGLFRKNKIYLFSPIAIEKFSPHKKTYIKKLITHELCHLFNHAINPLLPLWLNEGIALVIADQKKDSLIPKSDWLFFKKSLTNKKMHFKEFSEHSGYKISYALTSHLLDKLGRDGLFRLVKFASKKNKPYAKALNLSASYIDSLIN